MALTPGQLITIYTIAGLYGNEQGWVDEAAVNELAIYIGSVTGNDFNVAYNTRLAVECLKVAVARGVTGERTESLRRRIQELLARPAATIINPTGDAGLDAEIIARISGDNVEAQARASADTIEAATRALADTALGIRIDNIPTGAIDATARAGVAQNKAEITSLVAEDVVLAREVQAAQAEADDNQIEIAAIQSEIGNVSTDEPDIAAWITNFRQGVQGNAEAVANLESGKVDTNANAIAAEVTARELSDVNPGGGVGQVYAKASAADFDGVWVNQGGGGGGDDPVARAAAAAAQNTANEADTKAEANLATLGTVSPDLPNVGAWIDNFRSGIQNAADAAGNADQAAQAAQGTANTNTGDLATEVTAREAQGVTFTTAAAQNALHILAETTARRAADVALGLRIDGITTPDYRPGVPPYKFEGSTRAAAVAAREEYFLGEVALSQAYAQIFSAGAASRIRVTLDPSVPTQVGAAGNSWNLVLGTDHNNDSVTIVPDTPGETFTLRLPAAGITLDQLATDLDSNSRLNAEVVGNGAALVDYTATWGANPVVGSTTPFGNGGDQSTTERTAWRAVYEANPDLVIVLDYLDLEEYQHWGAADWESVLTLVDPPTPIWSAGSSQNFFTGSSRTAAAAARDEYSLRNTGVVQATRRLPLGTSPTAGVLVTLTADAAIGAVGNTWTLIANGAAFAGSNSALAYDLLNQVVGVNYNSANLTAEALAHLFNVTPGFSAELVGGISPTATGFVAAQLAGAFAGGVNAAFNPRTVWIADYDNDADQYITLEYGQTLERQVRRNSQWAAIDTIVIPKATPAGVRLLTHPNAVPGENYQWWQNVTNSTVGQSFIERTGGTIPVPEVGSEYLTIPATNSIVYFRVSDGTNTVIATLAHLVLPDGSRVASAVTVMLGTQPILLTILATGRVVGTRPTAGTTNVGLDAWVQ